VKVTIQSLTIEDLPEYADMIRAAFADVAAAFGLTRENAPLHTSFITNERLAAKFNAEYYPIGAVVEDKIVGFISLTRTGETEFELNNFCVLPQYRRDGVGGMLFDAAVERARALGARRIFLTMIYENKPLREWYARRGFDFIGVEREAIKPFVVGVFECRM
jgi:ribosomal protein S18 acetylase RimI-like enzyme